jgi:hypothetical protein
MIEFLACMLLNTSVTLYNSVNDQILHIKVDQEKIYLIKPEEKEMKK